MKKFLLMILVAMAATECMAQASAGDLNNKVIETIMQRRSIRQYTNKPVEREKLQLVAECGINAPSAMNRQKWAVRIVDDPKYINGATEVLKKKMPEMVARDKSFRNMFRNAPAIICVGIEAKEDEYSKVDAGLMGENMMLAAQSLGLGTCCLGMAASQLNTIPELKEYYDKLNLPEGYRLIYVLAIGYPDESPAAKPRDRNKIQFVE